MSLRLWPDGAVSCGNIAAAKRRSRAVTKHKARFLRFQRRTPRHGSRRESGIRHGDAACAIRRPHENRPWRIRSTSRRGGKQHTRQRSVPARRCDWLPLNENGCKLERLHVPDPRRTGHVLASRHGVASVAGEADAAHSHFRVWFVHRRLDGWNADGQLVDDVRHAAVCIRRVRFAVHDDAIRLSEHALSATSHLLFRVRPLCERLPRDVVEHAADAIVAPHGEHLSAWTPGCGPDSHTVFVRDVVSDLFSVRRVHDKFVVECVVAYGDGASVWAPVQAR
mmetsp:Transcript_2901/g.6535  ORF Transcript_2901/g.6535 Transcript_2901/m.6535 type:complete len:280 (-) Transcript_2901:92-931(-)